MAEAKVEPKKEKKQFYILREGFGLQKDNGEAIFADDGERQVELTEKEFEDNKHKLQEVPTSKK